MAVLSTGERAAGTAGFSEECSRDRVPVELTKANLRAAYDAADTWADTNAASFNTALPPAARNALTAPQKARLLEHVVRRRFINGL